MRKITSKWTFWICVCSLIILIGDVLFLNKDLKSIERIEKNYPNVSIYNELKSTLSAISNHSLLNGKTENNLLSEEYLTILNKEIERINSEISKFEKDDAFMIVINDIKISERYNTGYQTLFIFLLFIFIICLTLFLGDILTDD